MKNNLNSILLLLIVFCGFLTTSVLAQTDTKKLSIHHGIALERTEYSEDIFLYLNCLINKGYKQIRDAEKLAENCTSHQSKAEMQALDLTDQIFVHSLNKYDPRVREMFYCILRGAGRSYRSTDIQVTN